MIFEQNNMIILIFHVKIHFKKDYIRKIFVIWVRNNTYIQIRGKMTFEYSEHIKVRSNLVAQYVFNEIGIYLCQVDHF